MALPELPLVYRYRAPKNPQNPSPALILLHGYGSNEDDLFSFASELPEEYAIFSLRAPLPMQPYGYAWYSIYFDGDQDKFTDDQQALAAMETITSCIDTIKERFPVDPDRVCLVGFSQGCILSLAVGLSYPEKIRAIVGLSGYIHPPVIKEGIEQRDLSGLEIYSSHGTADMVIPVDWARKTKPYLEALGVPITYSEYPVGHGVAPQNFYEFRSWLKQRLD